MNDDDLKKIKSLLQEELGPIREDIQTLKTDFGEFKNILDERVLPSVTYIEQNIKSYADMYKMNNDNMKKLDKRLDTVEEDLGIQPPTELTLAEVQ